MLLIENRITFLILVISGVFSARNGEGSNGREGSEFRKTAGKLEEGFGG